MAKRKRHALLISLVVLLAGISFYITLRQMINPDQYRPWLIDTLEELTGHAISIKNIEFSPSGGG
ncbi:hypothetical protein ACQZV8_19835, partial [Magnetococcales bacterium HHB-1]